MCDRGGAKAQKGEPPHKPRTGRPWRPKQAPTGLAVPTIPPTGISDTKNLPTVYIVVLEYAPFEDKITDNTKHKKITQFWHLALR